MKEDQIVQSETTYWGMAIGKPSHSRPAPPNYPALTLLASLLTGP